jgi:hypothetical protein
MKLAVRSRLRSGAVLLGSLGVLAVLAGGSPAAQAATSAASLASSYSMNFDNLTYSETSGGSLADMAVSASGAVTGQMTVNSPLTGTGALTGTLNGDTIKFSVGSGDYTGTVNATTRDMSGTYSYPGQNGTWTAAPVSSSAPTTDCPAVVFIGVRGSGQSAAGYDGMGPEIDHVAQALQSALGTSGGSLKLVAVNYPADSVVDDLSPSAEVVSLKKSGHLIAAENLYEKTSLAKYDASIDRGFNGIMTDFNAAVAACPSTRIVLAGYSQGAIVVHEAESWIAAHLNAKLSRIAGTVLVGDPDRIAHTKATTFGTVAASAEGVRVYLRAVKAQDVVDPAETATIANRDDIVADFGFSKVLTEKSRDAATAVHTGYAREVGHTMVYDPALANAADWIETLIAAGK